MKLPRLIIGTTIAAGLFATRMILLGLAVAIEAAGGPQSSGTRGRN
jgi:hypothetical protein